MPNDVIHAFLMIGQSNMAGRGDFGEVAPIENPRLKMLRMGRWQPMSEPINPDRAIVAKFHSGIGPAASFADAVSAFTEGNIGLIPCADGGTAIEEWLPGTVLFDHAVMMTQLALRSATLSGIIWHQGESNCHERNYLGYGDRLCTVMTALRKALNAEHCPIVMGELSDKITPEWDCPRFKEVNAMIYRAAERLPDCGVASCKGLTLKKDGIHFDSASQRIFGVRYAEVYRTLIGQK